MADPRRPQILLTNDDGIVSPGLWAAAEALSELGYVTVAAPREQASGSGRSMPVHSDGILRKEHVEIRGKSWPVYAVGGSPAQAVQHGVLELTSGTPDLVVAGINYGENLTVSVTISGTVGAALEGAAFGIPSMAVSLEMPESYFMSHSEEVDFSAAAHFTQVFGRALLGGRMPDDVDLLKVDIPSDADAQTPWRMTRLSRVKYYVPVAASREHLGEAAPVGYEIQLDEDALEPDSDVYALRVAREVSVTPLSLDLTSRANLDRLARQLRDQLH